MSAAVSPLKAIIFMEKQSVICAELMELVKQLVAQCHREHPSSCHWLDCAHWPCVRAAELFHKSWRNTEEAAA